MKVEAISVLDDCGGGRFAVCACFRDIYVGAGQSQAAAPAVFKTVFGALQLHIQLGKAPRISIHGLKSQLSQI